MDEERKQLRGRRVDWLCWFLIRKVVDKVLHAQHLKEAGFRPNRTMETMVSSSVTAARQIPDSAVKLPEGAGQPAFVRSSAQSGIEYTVCSAGGADASCSCVHFSRGNLCKHIIKVSFGMIITICSNSSVS